MLFKMLFQILIIITQKFYRNNMFSNPTPYSNDSPVKSPYLNTYSTQLPPHQMNLPSKNLLQPIASNTLKNININSGINNKYPTKLSPYIQPQNRLGLTSKMITLVSLNEGSLHFHDEAANVFQRYQNNQIAFVGIWGAEDSDKSFFFDRLHNLADVSGDKYSQTSFDGSNSLLYFYERPFIKDNIRFFLVDAKGFKNPTSLTKTEKNQLDLLISVCQIIILIQGPQNSNQNVDILQSGYQHINESFRRLYIDKKKKEQPSSQVCWPKSLFILYNTSQSIKKHKKSQQTEQELCRMFKDYNFSILHNKKNNLNSEEQIKSYTTITNPLDELYLKNASMIFKEIYEKIEGKSYMNIKFNGFTIPHILTEIVYTLNQHENLYLPKSYSKAKKSVFSSLYNRYALAYLLKMKQYIGEQKPYSTDYLLKAFQNVSEQTLQQYHQTQNQITLRPAQDSLCLEYERKLQQYIEQKQKNILTVNNKKSAKQLTSVLNGNSDPYEELKKVQKNVTQNKRNFDQNAQTVFVGNTIKSILGSGMKVNSQPNNIQATNNNNKLYEQALQKEIQTQKQKQREEILKKQQQLIKKKVQLQLLSSTQKVQVQNEQMTQQINRFKNEELKLEQQISNEQKKLTVLRSKALQSQEHGNSGGSNDALIDEAKVKIQQLKNVLATKLSQRRQVQQMVRTNNIKDRELEVLQSKLFEKRLQVQKVKKSNVKGQLIQGAPQVQRRLISAHDANIRRVHGSRI